MVVRTLGESEFVGPPCRVGELSLGGGQITVQQAVQREVFVRQRDGVVGYEPQRLDVVFVVFGAGPRWLARNGRGRCRIHRAGMPPSPARIRWRGETIAALDRRRSAVAAAVGQRDPSRRAERSSCTAPAMSRTAGRRVGRCRPAPGIARNRRQQKGFDTPRRPRRGTRAPIAERSRAGHGQDLAGRSRVG